MRYGVLFETLVVEDKLIVDVLTENRQFRSFLENNVKNGSYLVSWYEKKKDEFEKFEESGYKAKHQVQSQAHSYFGLLIRDYIEYFEQNRVEYIGL